MMDWLVCDGRAGRIRPDDARGDGTRRPGLARHRVRIQRRGPRRVSRRRHRLRPIRPAGRHPAARGGHSRSPSSRRTPGVGGTWWENTYPGARVDVGNHFYCYSFEPTDHWTEYFAQQPELQAYFEDVMHRHGHRPARPVVHRGDRAPSGMMQRPPGRCGSGPPTRRHSEPRNPDRPRGDQRSRPAQPPASFPTSAARRYSTGPRSTPPAGITTSTSPASESP